MIMFLNLLLFKHMKYILNYTKLYNNPRNQMIKYILIFIIEKLIAYETIQVILVFLLFNKSENIFYYLENILHIFFYL